MTIHTQTFLDYIAAGLSVLPCRDKIPLVKSWKALQAAPASAEQVAAWNSPPQVACVCGAVSGGLVCLDFDIKNGNEYENWQDLINRQNPHLLSDMVSEKTPSGGYHVLFRSDYKIGNIKLACNEAGLCTIETRGEGGYFVCAPSDGYVLEFGTIAGIKKVSQESTELLINSAKSLNKKAVEGRPETAPRQVAVGGGLSPFDDYDAQTDPTAILTKAGWTAIFKRGEVIYFQRPGKNKGISASWNAIPNRFYCFSTSTNFENNHIYKASAVYAMIEHGGNYRQAAGALVAAGYGKPPEKPHAEAVLVKTDGMIERLLYIKQHGYSRGKSTGWRELDCLYSVIKGQLTVITGMPSHGKSEFMDAMMINVAMLDGWKFAVFSPENYPVELHFHKLVEKKFGSNLHRMEDEHIAAAVGFIREHFYFIDGIEEDINIEAIMDQTEKLIIDKKIDGLVLDPWNEIELSKPKDISDSDYIGVCLRKLRKFARKHDIHLWIVAHPTKMAKDKAGKYPIPELYDIMGSAHWRNKADNGICVYRNFENDTTEIYVQKIKFRYAGTPGLCTMKYDVNSGRYNAVENINNDFWKNMG